MGLLGDSWDDPQSLATLQLAGGLLSPGSFGQGLQRGLVGYQGALSAAQDLADKKQAAALQNAQMKMLQQKLDILSGAFGGNGGAAAGAAPGAQAPAAGQPAAQGAVGAMPGGATPMGGTAPRAPAFPFSLPQISALKLAGFGDLLPDYKVAMEGFKKDAGALYTYPDGHTEYMPDPTKNIDFDPATRRVSLLPGSLDTQSAISQATKAGEMRGTNQNTLAPADRIDPNTGRPYAMTLDQLIQTVNGGGTVPQPVTSPQDFSPEMQKRILASIQRNGDTSFALQSGGKAPMYVGAQGAAPTPAAPQATGAFPGFQGPAEAAAEKVAAENRANLATRPAVVSAEDNARNVQQSDKTYSDALNLRVEEGFNLKRRNAEILQQLDDYRTGIGNAEGRMHIASNLVNMFPGNSQIEAVAQKINGGSVVSAQTLHNLVAGAMITNAIQVLQGQGRLNKAEVERLGKAAENPETDPGALRRIIAIQNRFADQDFAEQQARAAALKSGTYSPATWQADYAAQKFGGMKDPNSVFSPATPATPATPASGAAPAASSDMRAAAAAELARRKKKAGGS